MRFHPLFLLADGPTEKGGSVSVSFIPYLNPETLRPTEILQEQETFGDKP